MTKIRKKEVPYTHVKSLKDRLNQNAEERDYKGFIGVLKYGSRYLKNYYLGILANFMPYSAPRVTLHRARGAHIGENVLIGQNVVIDNTYPELVYIGDGVSLAGNNLILTHSRPLEFHKKWFESYIAPVVIEKNVWITVGVTILAGVHIGEGSVIAANSLVSKDIPEYSLAAGTPAKVIKKLD